MQYGKHVETTEAGLHTVAIGPRTKGSISFDQFVLPEGIVI